MRKKNGQNCTCTQSKQFLIENFWELTGKFWFFVLKHLKNYKLAGNLGGKIICSFLFQSGFV